jgi:hypothetical protein
MPTSQKTVEYAFAFNATGAAAAANCDMTQLAALAIPETTGRVFRSVMLVFHWRDNSGVGTDHGSPIQIGIKLGAVAIDTQSVSTTINHSTETHNFCAARNVTSYFSTNYTGTSMTADARLNVATAAIVDVSAKLIITYDYDTAATTRLKTVRIPLEGNNSAITTTLTNLAGLSAQVPNLSTFCPEASKTFRDIFFEVWYNEAITAATTDGRVGLALDSESDDFDTAHVDTLVTSRTLYRIWKRTDMSTSAAHDFKVRTDVTPGLNCDGICAILTVTYEYNEASTTTVLNSIVLPVQTHNHQVGQTAAGDQDIYSVKFFIEEPTTITLAQSGVFTFWNSATGGDINVKGGSQASRTSAIRSGTTVTAQSVNLRRLDAGGNGGVAGIAVARGENDFRLRLETTGSGNFDRAVMVNSFLYLNYTSGKASGGTQAHNHTVIHLMDAFGDLDLIDRSFTWGGPNIPESNYWLTGFGVLVMSIQEVSGVSNGGFSLQAQRLSGEGIEVGWQEVGLSVGSHPSENGMLFCFRNVTPFFERHPGDPNTDRLVVGSSREWRIGVIRQPGTQAGTMAYITYHGITFSAAGTSTGHTGSGHTVTAYRVDTKEKLYTTSTDGSGNFTITGYDNTISLFNECRIDDTKVARSGNYTLA